MVRMAQHVASTTQHGSALTVAERYDAALDAIVDFVAVNGWPEDNFRDLFRDAAMGVAHAGREATKHLRYWSYWYEPPGSEDALGEALTDRIGVHELCQAFSENEWLAVWSMAEAIRRGQPTLSTAAAIAGLTDSAFTHRLHRAQAKGRALWVAAGDTPAARYHAHKSKPARARWRRNSKSSRLWSEEEAA
jgi:hypothetical protein